MIETRKKKLLSLFNQSILLSPPLLKQSQLAKIFPRFINTSRKLSVTQDLPTTPLFLHSEDSEEKTRYSFRKKLCIFGIIGSCCYGSLYGIFNYYENNSASISINPLNQILCSRLISHLGPYLLPLFLKSGIHNSLTSTVHSSPHFTRKKFEAIADLSQLTQRSTAITHLSHSELTSKDGDNSNNTTLQIILNDFVSEKQSAESEASLITLWETELKIILDLVSTLPPHARAVPYEDLILLVNTNSKNWKSSSVLEEYRATILLKLIENEENSKSIIQNEAPEFLESAQNIKTFSKHLLILDYLYNKGLVEYPKTLSPLTRMFLSGECHSIYLKSIYQLNKFIDSYPLNGLEKKYPALPLPPQLPRNTLPLEKKIDYNALNNFIHVCAIYSIAIFALKHHPTSKFSINLTFPLIKIFFKSLSGVAILESIYRVQENIINSQLYFNDKSFMIKLSIAFALTNILSLTFVTHFQRQALAPFIFLKLYCDTVYDNYRSL